MICDGKPGTLKEALEAYEEVLTERRWGRVKGRNEDRNVIM